MPKTFRKSSILAKAELEKLATPRLMAYKRALMKCHEGSDYDDDDDTYSGFHKGCSSWKAAYADLKAVLATREHINKSWGNKGKKLTDYVPALRLELKRKLNQNSLLRRQSRVRTGTPDLIQPLAYDIAPTSTAYVIDDGVAVEKSGTRVFVPLTEIAAKKVCAGLVDDKLNTVFGSVYKTIVDKENKLFHEIKTKAEYVIMDIVRDFEFVYLTENKREGFAVFELIGVSGLKSA